MFFSVIIPTYNSEYFIQDCLKSLLSSKFNDYEVIIIDDKSTDNTIKICHEVSEKNPDISFKILLNKKNLGVSFCRNLGIKNSIGQYIIFVDSDDIVDGNKLQSFKDEIAQNQQNVDILFCNEFRTLRSNNLFTKHYIVNDYAIKNIKNVDDLFHYIVENKIFYSNCWNFIVQRSFLETKKINFTISLKYAEDQEFVSKVFINIKSFLVLKDFFYFKRTGFSTLTHNLGKEVADNCLEASLNLYRIFEKNKLNKNKQLFLYQRIENIISLLIPQLLSLNEHDLTYLIKKNDSQRKLKKIRQILSIFKICHDNKLLDNPIENMYLEIKNYYISRIINIIEKFSSDNIFLFSYNTLSISVIKCLKNSKYNIRGIIDNDALVYGKKVDKINTYSLNNAIKYYDNLAVLITNQNRDNVDSIRRQLIENKVTKKNISDFYLHPSKIPV